MVWALSATTTVSYGVLYYAFAAFLLPMRHDLGFSLSALTGAFTLSMLLTGAAAIPVGAWLDRHGARLLMTAGSLLGAGSVLAWSQVHTLPGIYLAFAGMGIAGAAVQYEPAFATVNAYFDLKRRQALLTITVVAGFASTIFLPASAILINSLGWRHALWVLAVVQGLTAIPHALILRRRPSDHGWQRDGQRGAEAEPVDAVPLSSGTGPDRTVPGGPMRTALGSRSVLFLTLGTVLGSAAIGTVSAHLVSYLREHGDAATIAASATGLLGAMQVLGRILLTAAAHRVRLAAVTALMLGGQVLAVILLISLPGAVGVAGFVVLFGAGFGVLHIARADLLAAYVPRELYARVSGVQALLVITVEGFAPTGASVLRTSTGSYTPVFLAVGACALTAAISFLAADAHRAAATPAAPAETATAPDHIDARLG